MVKRYKTEEKVWICYYARKYSVKEASVKFNVSTGSIYKWLKNYPEFNPNMRFAYRRLPDGSNMKYKDFININNQLIKDNNFYRKNNEIYINLLYDEFSKIYNITPQHYKYLFFKYYNTTYTGKVNLAYYGDKRINHGYVKINGYDFDKKNYR